MGPFIVDKWIRNLFRLPFNGKRQKVKNLGVLLLLPRRIKDPDEVKKSQHIANLPGMSFTF